MEKTYKYSLDKSSKKFKCPDCEKKTFVRYKDSSGKYLSDESFGRCDREINCGCMNVPKEENKEKTIEDYEPKKTVVKKPTSYIPNILMENTWGNYKHNPFTLFLVELFGDDKTVELIKKYRWGVDVTSIYTRLYTIFWQIDTKGKVRSGKMVKYGKDGHRDKDSYTTWYHKKTDGLKPLFPDFELEQCLFGEHLISEDLKRPIAIVESEKTAIIASMFLPKYIWLSCGGLTQLSYQKIEVLKNRSVTLFPDLGSIGRNGDKYIDQLNSNVWEKENGIWYNTGDKKDKWNEGHDKRLFRTGKGNPASAFSIWKEIAKKNNWSISDHIKKIATPEQREKGLDLADFLTMQ